MIAYPLVKPYSSRNRLYTFFAVKRCLRGAVWSPSNHVLITGMSASNFDGHTATVRRCPGHTEYGVVLRTVVRDVLICFAASRGAHVAHASKTKFYLIIHGVNLHALLARAKSKELRRRLLYRPQQHVAAVTAD